MSLRTTISLALLALVSFADGAMAAKPTTPDAVIAVAKGEERTNISFDDKHVYVDVGDKQLVGESQSIKRFWRRGPAGEAVAEVKSGDDGFKIRTPADKLILKVKVSADKIKIADNEEMQNAWSIKFKANENAKVFDAKEKQVGAVKFAADTGKIKIKDAADKDVYVVESGKRSNSYGALLLKDVPEEYRRILLGELFVRGL